MANEGFLRPSTPEQVNRPVSGAQANFDVVAGGSASARPFLQVYFVCSNTYQRVFRSADGQRYQARCPKCAKEMRFQVGPGGTDQRVFQVSCL
jgi:hypothetical protein